METFLEALFRICGNLFKSYYVVWKRIRRMNTGKNFLSFKSYYVVWKHSIKFPYYIVIISLNRTM